MVCPLPRSPSPTPLRVTRRCAIAQRWFQDLDLPVRPEMENVGCWLGMLGAYQKKTNHLARKGCHISSDCSKIMGFVWICGLCSHEIPIGVIYL